MKTLKQFFEILRPHWFGKGAAKLWALLLLALGFSLAIIKISVLMNAWDKRFYDALSELKGELIPALVGEFLLYTALIVLFIVCGSWLRKLLVIVWRERLSAMMERKWLHNANFYRTSLEGNFSARGSSNLEKPGDANLNERAEYSAAEADSAALYRDAKGLEILPSAAEQNAAGQSGASENEISSKTRADCEISKTIAKLDNPDQRIAEDSLLLVQKSVDLVKSLVYNLAKLIAFVAILWQVSKVLKFEIFGMHFAIEGFLLYVALIYTLLCSLITHLIGRRLRGLNFTKQRAEAGNPVARARKRRSRGVYARRGCRARPLSRELQRDYEKLAQHHEYGISPRMLFGKLPKNHEFDPDLCLLAAVFVARDELWRHDAGALGVLQRAGRICVVYGLLQADHGVGGERAEDL